MSFSSKGTVHRSTVTGRRGMIASAHPLASLAGVRMLMQGGNAFDAIIATAAALNVVEPYMSGLGGNGYMHFYHAASGTHQVIDYMGTTPAGAHLHLYDSDEKHTKGPLTPLVPGAPAGWLAALEKYGTMDPIDVFAPAIEYAELGFPLTVINALWINWDAPNLRKFPNSGQVYIQPGREAQAGDILIQKDLANTFRQIGRNGVDAFYRGDIADRIVSYMADNGGLITHEDLQGLQIHWQTPLHTDYRGFKIYAPEPPCQAVQFFETLNIMEGFDVGGLGHNSTANLHNFIEAAKLSTADRIAHTIGNPPPTAGLISKEFAAARRAQITDRAQVTAGERFNERRLAGEVEPGDPWHFMQTENTTHFEAVDAQGNAVAVTQSLGGLFGSSVVIPGTGLALNDFIRWMDREADSPNAIAPNKKPEMCMSPVQVWKDGRLRFMVGTPGSYGIMQTTPQMIMNVIDHDMNIQAAIEAARVRTSEPGLQVDVESRVPEDVRAALAAMGHEINVIEPFSAMVGGGQGIAVDPETGAFMGGADPRRDGYALGY